MTAPAPDPTFEALLQFLYETHGSDFTGYKRSTLVRRVRRRLEQLRIAGFDEYVDYLQVHPEEHAALFDTILINVTSFFRDPPAWEYMRREVIPRITAGDGENERQVRVWSAGCASGEEAYTIAMLIAEEVGVDELKRRVKVYATDIDEQALARARMGTYTAKELAAVPEELRTKYFEMQGTRGTFPADLRRTVIFGRHDLLQDAPISRLDLLICRNTLMYFTAESQARILARLHYALNEGGYLFVGRAEMLLTHANLFAPGDLKHRIFARVATPGFRSRLRILAQGGVDAIGNHVGRQVRLREAALDAGGNASIVVDSDGILVMANELARTVLSVNPRDIGRRLQDTEVSYRPVELRAVIDQALSERRTVQLSGVERVDQSDGAQYFDVAVTPLIDPDGEAMGVSITYKDVTSLNRVKAELARSRQELETAYEELQSTNEELETTNEELQSTVEELETTNEELQSANEELETMNEELQSTNGELESINTELSRRSEDVIRLNSFVESVLASLEVGVAVLDNDLRVVVWNARSADLWGLREYEVVGQPFMALDIGLPVGQLALPIRRCLSGEPENNRVLEALTRRGRTIQCRVSCSPVRSPNGTGRGVVVLMEEVDGAGPEATK